jgi:hypothetical protein
MIQQTDADDDCDTAVYSGPHGMKQESAWRVI